MGGACSYQVPSTHFIREENIMETVMQTSGCGYIDLSGMSPDCLQRVREIGFDAWLDEYNPKAVKRTAVVSIISEKPKEKPIVKCLCTQCGNVFLSHTRATKKCEGCGGSPTGILQRDGKQLRACASGMECLKAGKHTPAEAASGKQYCSKNCHESHKARLARVRVAA